MLKLENSYTLRFMNQMSTYDTSTLISLYGPLMGRDAVILYSALLEQATFSIPTKNHSYLSSVTGFSASRMERIRGDLESYLLLKSYYNKDDESYIYEIVPPLSRTAFLSHDVFGRLYQQRMGIELYTFLVQQDADVEESDGFQDISKSLNVDFYKQWRPSDEELFSNAKAKSMDDVEVRMDFDYDEFLVISNMVFPKQARTRKNLQTIARVANLYAIKASDMRKLVARSFDIVTNTLDEKKLEYLANKNMPTAQLPNDIYEATPFQFLQYKQNGVPIAESDRKLINDLLMKYKLAPEVVNVLIEFTLNMTDQKFNRSYVEKVATTWVRQNIDTKELAIAATKESSNPYAKKDKDVRLPDWYYEDVEHSTGDSEEIDKDLEEALKLLGGK